MCKYKSSFGMRFWIVLTWIVPAVAAFLLTSVVLNTAIWVNRKYPHPKHLFDMSADMLGFLGLVVAVLIAVITTLYIQSSQSRESAFRDFLQSRNHVSLLRLRIDVIKSRMVNQCSVNEWMTLADGFIDRMNEITLEWLGYDEHPEMEKNMLCYIHRSNYLLLSLLKSDVVKSDGLDQNTIKLILSEVFYTQEGHVRVMVTALLSMDKGMLGKRLVDSLLWLSCSLTLLLLLALLVRTTTGVDHISMFASSEFFDLFTYCLIPAVAAAHVVGFVVAVYLWRRSVQKREREWLSHGNSGEQCSTDTSRYPQSANPVLALLLFGTVACVLVKVWRSIKSRISR